MKVQNTPQQSFSDKQPKAIVKVIIGCLVFMLVCGSLGYAYMQKQKTSLTETVTIEDDEVAAGITEEVMKAVEERLVTITDENGNTVELDEEEMATLQTLCTAEILETLQGTDLMSLSNEQMQQLITNLKKNIIENVLKQSDISQYFTEKDYEEIAKYITQSSTTELGSLQKQITDNKQASEQRDVTQDNAINELKASIKDVKSTVTENEKSGGGDLSAIKNDITNINSNINDTNNNLTNAKEKLTELINSNTALDAQTKEEMLKKIDDESIKTAADIAKLCDEMTESLNTLSIKSASSIDELNASLNEAINDNAALSEAERKKLLDIVNANDAKTSEDIVGLASDLTAEVEKLTSLSETQKQALLGQIGALKSSTAADIASLNKSINDKYDVYFEVPFSQAVSWSDGAATISITSEYLKTYSDINVVYDDSCKIGYTVTYQQSDGSLQLSLKANANVTPPATISGKLYIDNSMVNAQ